jgi:hypothetical protein
MSVENLDNEDVIYTSDPFATKGLTRRDILVSALLFFIGFFLFLGGLALIMITPIILIIGILMFLGGIGWVIIRSRPRRIKGVHYVLTNKRAMVIHTDWHGEKIIQECNLTDTIPIVQKKRTINVSQQQSETATTSTSVTVGDVVFMQRTTPKVIFRDVEDPDGILRTVEQIKRSMLT